MDGGREKGQEEERKSATGCTGSAAKLHRIENCEPNRLGKPQALKQLFREEIKKSYEEYVEQVGREFAEGTTHFQDALNDVLAAGKKLF